MIPFLWQLFYFFCAARIVVGEWSTTKFLFTFGDSYTTDGFNISAGVDSPVPSFVSTRGVAISTVSAQKSIYADHRHLQMALIGFNSLVCR